MGTLLARCWNQENPTGTEPSMFSCCWDLLEVFAQLQVRNFRKHLGLLPWEVGVAQQWHRGGTGMAHDLAETRCPLPSTEHRNPKPLPQQPRPLQARCWWQCWDCCPQAGDWGCELTGVLLGIPAGNQCWESLGVTGNSCWESLQRGRAKVLGRRCCVHGRGDHGCREGRNKLLTREVISD